MTDNPMATAGPVQRRKNASRPFVINMIPGSPLIIAQTQAFPRGFADGDPNKYNLRFITILDDLRSDVLNTGIKLSIQKRDHYMKRLAKLGGEAYNIMLHDNTRQYIKAYEAEDSQRGIRLSVMAPPESMFFWEMLYTEDTLMIDYLDTVIPSHFWGFNYPIGRYFLGVKSPEDRIRFQEGVFSAVHEELKLSLEEVKKLGSYIDLLTRRGMKVSFRILDEVFTSEQISIVNFAQLLHDEKFRYGMVHFACHFENPEDGGAGEAALLLTAHKKKLQIPLYTLIINKNYSFLNKPFVFMNACSSATAGHLLESANYPAGLLNFGAGGVIATACAVPDTFAAEFGAEFYRRLLRLNDQPGTEAASPADQQDLATADVAQVLLETRLHFLENYNNPLGLAYLLFAHSHQLIEFPIEQD
jgi:hypothetical protein